MSRTTTDALNELVNNEPNGLKPQINAKADKSSPALTGVPTAPTPDDNADSTQIATTEFCQNLIRRLVGTAPETLNTLVELATAINNDPNFATTIVQALDNKLNKTDAANTYLSKTGTAAAASKVTGGTVSLTGSITGSGTFNSAGNVTINTTGGGTVTTLYSDLGSSTTGGMTQKAISDQVNSLKNQEEWHEAHTAIAETDLYNLIATLKILFYLNLSGHDMTVNNCSFPLYGSLTDDNMSYGIRCAPSKKIFKIFVDHKVYTFSDTGKITFSDGNVTLN